MVKRKQTVHLGACLMQEVHAEALRVDRSISWLFQMAWQNARQQIAAMPSRIAAEKEKVNTDLTPK